MAWPHAESPFYYVAMVLPQQNQLLFRVAWIGAIGATYILSLWFGHQLLSHTLILPGCLTVPPGAQSSHPDFTRLPDTVPPGMQSSH